MRTSRLLAAFLGLGLACAAALPARAQGAAAEAVLSTAVATVDQIYVSGKKRNPLKASTLNIDEHGPKSLAASTDVARGTFSVYGLALTGLLEDPRSKEAMLTDQATGEFFTLKGGRLLDSRKRVVRGVSGVIKGKQVILMTDDKKLHHLTLQKKE